MFRSMFNNRRPARAPVRPVAAAWEPLESRQLLSASLAPAINQGLTVTYTKTTLPTSVLSGSKIKGAVTLQLTNSATTNDTGVNTFAIYASADSVIDPTSDTLLGTLSKKLNLKTGATTKVTIPVKSVLAPAAGDYNVLISATNADTTTSTTELMPAPSLDVAASFVKLNPVVGAASPTALTAGKPITLKVTITNSGNVNSTGTLTTEVGLSTDGVTVPPNSIYTQERNVTIKADSKAISITFKIKIPVGTAAGTYFPAVTLLQGLAPTVTGFSTTPITIGT